MENHIIKTIHHGTTQYHWIISSLPWRSPLLQKCLISHPSAVPYNYLSLSHRWFSTQAEANCFSKEYNNVKETITSYNMLSAEKRNEKLRIVWLPMVGEFSNRWSPRMVLVDVRHSTHTVERALGLPLTTWPPYPRFLHKDLIIPSCVDVVGVGIL